MILRLIATVSVLFVLSCSSCTFKTKAIHEALDNAERMIASYPDSALTLLKEIEPGKIHIEKAKARHSLPMSVALDKLHIDLQSDSLIKPALQYYSRYIRSEEALMTFYYTARVYENAGDLENSMKFLIKAEKTRNHDNLYVNSLVHSAKGRIYNQLHEYGMASTEFRQAAYYCIEDGDYNKYVSNRIREATCIYMMRDYIGTRKILEDIYIDKDIITESVLGKYYQLTINLAEIDNREMLPELLEEYKENISIPFTDWLLIARIESSLGNLASAEEAINMQRKYRKPDAAFHNINSSILEAEGNFKEALSEYKRYISLSGIIGNQIIDQDTRFIEEREMHLVNQEKADTRNLILLLTCIVIMLGLGLAITLMITIRKQLQLKEHEQRELMRQIDELITEREELTRTDTENNEARRIISERLRIIDNFVFSDVLQDEIFEKQALETLKQIIANREDFIHHNRIIFNQSYPQFIKYLKDHELTEKEIEHCCLYAIGLNGKMATTFTNLKRHYHIGSSIRKKLGLNGHDTNISIHIKQLFKELQA